MRKGTRALVCPECDKRGVTLRLRPGGNDHYGCRYCDWFAYTSGYDGIDVERRRVLAEANPDRTVVQ